MGASLLVLSNKSDIDGYMTENEIRAVGKTSALPASILMVVRGSNSIPSKHTRGQSCNVVPSQDSISKRDLNGWFRVLKKGFFSIRV